MFIRNSAVVFVAGYVCQVNGANLRSLTDLVVCSSDVAQVGYDAVMPPLINAFNSAWPQLAASSGIDPLTGVSIPNVDIPCKYGGDEICGLQASSCDKSWVQMDFNYLNGLGDLEIASYNLGTIDTNTSSCDSNSLPAGASCGYHATPAMTADLISGGKLEANLQNLKFKVKCKDAFGSKFDETIASFSSVTCKSTDATATMDSSVCGSNCNIFSASVSNLKISSSTKVTCDVSGLSSSIVDLVVPTIQSTLFNVVEPIAESEMNKELSNLIGTGYPNATCT
uniref:Uncharacterized protein n=1 Tax=Mucochytrium quahogii TaxID=96639 RepID=A0A7S2W7K3_9STRA|mmetsp:Transcript_16058/g.34802  ORF Transcript_16058/g.34802 Transcript_16058/m.34802 type:complete len:282 (+) Transcript_16058:597-1442(+)